MKIKEAKGLSHVDEAGKARMVDVGDKPPLSRTAIARGHIRLAAATRELIRTNAMKKGDVLTVAEIAGVQAAKQTPQLIPLCHPLMITHVTVHATLDRTGVSVESLVRCTGRTGVEMEALTAVSVALLTVYDMCKAADPSMVISDIRLIEKKKTMPAGNGNGE